MKIALPCLFALALAAHADPERNPAVPAPKFALPGVTLRAKGTQPTPGAAIAIATATGGGTATPAASTLNAAVEHTAPALYESALAPPVLQKYVGWIRQSWVAPLPADRPVDLFERFFRLFPEPRTVQLGKVSVSGGIVTAIESKNPLGLINQDVFSLQF